MGERCAINVWNGHLDHVISGWWSSTIWFYLPKSIWFPQIWAALGIISTGSSLYIAHTLTGQHSPTSFYRAISKRKDRGSPLFTRLSICGKNPLGRLNRKDNSSSTAVFDPLNHLQGESVELTLIFSNCFQRYSVEIVPLFRYKTQSSREKSGNHPPPIWTHQDQIFRSYIEPDVYAATTGLI